MLVLAIFTYQMAIRNPSIHQEKLAESNRLYFYSLDFYPELLLGDSLASMQALALFLVHARNLPKPGNSWNLSTTVLRRAVELDYHRSSNKIVLPAEQKSALAIELRKRVFWSILGIQVTVAVKMGNLSPSRAGTSMSNSPSRLWTRRSRSKVSMPFRAAVTSGAISFFPRSSHC